MESLCVYWMRRDFRVHDNKAFYEAAHYAQAHNIPLVPLFVIDAEFVSQQNIGYCRRAYLATLLAHMLESVKGFTVLYGNPHDIFTVIAQRYEVHIFSNSDVEPYSIKRDAAIQQLVPPHQWHSYADSMTVSPDLRSGSGTVYTVFTPFRNASIHQLIDSDIADTVDTNLYKTALIDAPVAIYAHHGEHRSHAEYKVSLLKTLDAPHILSYAGRTLDLDAIHPRISLDALNIYTSESEVLARLDEYIAEKIMHYKETRDSLTYDVQAGGGTSRMSIALKWGLVSARYIVKRIIHTYSRDVIFSQESVFHFVSELMWREFYRYILYHNPHVLDTEYQEKFRPPRINWEYSTQAHDMFLAWIKGQTGYPIVDACMSQLAHRYWMHNRGRMIVGSILTKNLGIDWRWGQAYFRCMLLDLDEASNNGGWQWSASVGADPKPIRIFNPYLQAQRYDSNGLFTRYWLHHAPYPSPSEPLIDHARAREKALMRYGLSSTTKPRDY